MAVQEIIPDRHIVYKNGAVYDREAKRIVFHRPDLATVDTQITPAKSSEMLAIRLERKRKRVEAGALAFVRKADPETWEEAEGDDWIEAVSEAQMAQALRVGDPGMTRAADWLMTHAGLGEKQAAEPQVQATNDTINALAGLLQAITAAVKTGDNSNYRNHDIVDGDTVADTAQQRAGDASERE